MEQYREHPQPRELYHCGYDLANRWPKEESQRGGGRGEGAQPVHVF